MASYISDYLPGLKFLYPDVEQRLSYEEILKLLESPQQIAVRESLEFMNPYFNKMMDLVIKIRRRK